MSFTKSPENVTPTREEVYQALLRSLKRRKGFGIVFVQCSTAETARIIQRIQQDLPEKKFGVLSLPPPNYKRDIFGKKTPPVKNLYDIVVNLPDRENINILLIQGLEKSLEPYIKPGYGGDGNYYNLDTVPPILSHLNQRREKFRDDFSNICFVFILPLFAIKYLIRRAPDFFDWSAGVFAIESEQLEQESRQTYNIGNTYFSLGEIEQAIAFYQQSLTISLEIKDRQGEAISLGGLGNANYSLGQYQQAIAFYEQSLAISQEIQDHQGEAVALGNLGNAYYSLAQFREAIAFYEQSLEISREIGNRQGEVASLIGLGNAYYSLAQYQLAIEYYQQSLAISREIGNRQEEATVLGNLGNAYRSLAQYQLAVDYYQQSLAISREIENRQGEVASLLGLGNAYYSLAQYQLAVDYYQQSLAISREIRNRQGEANSLGNLGNAYYSLAQYQLAVDYYQQSLAISREIGSRQGEANSLGNLGNAYRSLAQFERAIAFYEQSLAISREIGDRQGEANSLENLIIAYESLGEDERAIWQFFRSKAKSPPSWLQFLTEAEIASVERGTRKLMLPLRSEKIKLRIPANESLWMVIDLPFQNYQLLLLNRSKQGQYLLCPSSAYAPNLLIEKSPLLLPQKDSLADRTKQKFIFEETGQEEFLAIVFEKPLNLPWLTTKLEEALPEWNAKRMKELFEQLEHQGDWHVFYQSFEVV